MSHAVALSPTTATGSGRMPVYVAFALDHSRCEFPP